MQNIYSIATKPIYFKNLLNGTVPVYEACYQARPGMVLPIILGNGTNKMVLATWGLATLSSKEPITQVHMRHVLKHRPYNRMIRTARCAIPANCFILNNKEPRLVRLLKQRVFCLGGIYEYAMKNGANEYRFAILQAEPADMLQSYCTEMPICFGADRWNQWTDSEHIGDVMYQADRSLQLWFDHFRVSEKISDPTQNDRELLKPLEASRQQLLDKEASLEGIDERTLRANMSSKH
jgi:putative SOS response-associated peptidase YedK